MVIAVVCRLTLHMFRLHRLPWGALLAAWVATAPVGLAAGEAPADAAKEAVRTASVGAGSGEKASKSAKTANSNETPQSAETAAVRPGDAARAAPATPPPPAPPPKPAPAAETDAPAPLDIPTLRRLLTEGEMLIVSPGQNVTVESPAASERRLPVIDQRTGEIRWVALPARHKQVVAIRWLDTSNIKKLVEIEMLAGDLFLAASPREQADLSLAVRGRTTGVVFESPSGWTAVEYRSVKVHVEVDASLRIVGYGHSLLPAADNDPALALGMHIFASLRPGASVQNAGAATLVLEQYSTATAGTGWSGKPRRIVLPPETSVSTSGGVVDLRHFYVAEPGQPAGPPRIQHVGANLPEAVRAGTGQGTGGARAADANPGILP